MSAIENSNRKIENIYITNNFIKKNEKLFEKIKPKKHKIVDENFFKTKFEQNQNHQYIAAEVAPITIYDISYVTKHNIHSVCILDQITDVQNLGSILRSALAFEFQAVIIPEHGSVVENAYVAKASSGAIEKVKIIQVTNLNAAMLYLKENGFWIYGFDMNGVDLKKEKLPEKVGFVFGSEGSGIRRLVKENCDAILSIPMSSNMESLNVAHAASIAFYSRFNQSIA
jgi:23S rRNA (guanosine2251-2'-O)-methyltransferase